MMARSSGVRWHSQTPFHSCSTQWLFYGHAIERIQHAKCTVDLGWDLESYVRGRSELVRGRSVEVGGFKGEFISTSILGLLLGCGDLLEALEPSQ